MSENANSATVNFSDPRAWNPFEATSLRLNDDCPVAEVGETLDGDVTDAMIVEPGVRWERQSENVNDVEDSVDQPPFPLGEHV
jgi:hypothetical protein